MTRYERAPKEAERIIDRMLKKYHAPLSEAGLSVDCLFAFAAVDGNGDQTGPAVKLNGYPCAAVVRIIGLKDRTAGRGDAEIVVDGDEWPTWSDEERDALIDHELEHLELVLDREGLVKRDDLDRPKLKIRKHDHQFGWFDSIARRHGKASFEVRQFRKFHDEHGNLWLSFMDESDDEDYETSQQRLVNEVSNEFRKAGILAEAK